MQICAKLTQPVTIPLHCVSDVLALLQQLRQWRILDALDHASMRDAASQEPVAYCTSQLRAGIPARAPNLIQRSLPIAFRDGALQLAAFFDNLRRIIWIETETAFSAVPRQI